MPVNDVTLDARLAARDDLRFTPAGVAALNFQLAAVALGPIAKELASIAVGERLRCRGFLARRYRTGVSVALHVNAFERLEGN